MPLFVLVAFDHSLLTMLRAFERDSRPVVPVWLTRREYWTNGRIAHRTQFPC